MPNTYTLIASNTLSSSAASVTENDFTEEHIQRYLEKKVVTEQGCWVLPKNRSHNGYTQFSKKGIRRMAHRVMWVLDNGNIPDGMDVDHMCHNQAVMNNNCEGGIDCPHRACFNPEHLRLVSRSENVTAGIKGFFSRSTCSNGHTREPQNVRYRKGTELPFCWTCHKRNVMLYKRRKKAEVQ